MAEEMEDWFSRAEGELEYAKVLLKNGKYHHSCYLAQQVAEKALTAALLEFGVIKERGSVTTLVSELGKLTRVPPNIEKTAQFLDACYAPPSFADNYDPSVLRRLYNPEHVNESLRLAQLMVDFARKVVGDHQRKK
jgi:HEPN domain-containing protein